MADGGGVIIDDAGAVQTRIFQHTDRILSRADMSNLTNGLPVSIRGVQLRGYMLKNFGAVSFGAVNTAVVTATDGSSVTLTLSVSNSGGNAITIDPNGTRLPELPDPELRVYRLDGVLIRNITINGQRVSVTPQHTLLILEFS
jgi:hypothetical protein